MKENKQNLGQSTRSGSLPRQRLRDKGHGCGLLASPRVVVGALALLLLAISALGPLVIAKNVYAVADCGILFPCNTPTPSPLPSPTPTNTPTPRPTPPPRPTPHPTPTPSPTATAAPAATATPTALATPTVSAQTPTVNPTSVPVPISGNTGDRTPGTSGGSGFFTEIVIVVIIFLVLLSSLAASWFILRRALLPQPAAKLPPSGARPWSRIHVPNPDSSAGMGNTATMQVNMNATPLFVEEDNSSSSSGFEQFNGTDAPLPKKFDSTYYGFAVLPKWQDPDGPSDSGMSSQPVYPPGTMDAIPSGRETSPTMPTNNAFVPEQGGESIWWERTEEERNGNSIQTGINQPLSAPLSGTGLLSSAPYYLHFPVTDENENLHETWQ